MNDFISYYIDKIDVIDVIDFGKKNGVAIDKNEASTILFHLKNNWEELLYGDPLPIIREMEDEIGKTKCLKIKELLLFYKDKYKNYL